MTPRILVMTASAEADLDEIYDFILADNAVAADRFVTALVADLHRVAHLGYTGVERGWIRPGLRLHIYGNYCAYFRVDEHHFNVVRIVHGARDIDAIIFEPPSE